MAQTKRHQTDPLEDLRRDFEALREDVGALAQVFKDEARLRQRELTDSATDRVVALRSASEERLDEIRDRATLAAHRAEDVVRRNPAYAVGGAAALGFLVGAIFSRRR